MKKNKVLFMLFLVISLIAVIVTGCGKKETTPKEGGGSISLEPPQGENENKEEDSKTNPDQESVVKIAVLKGPTGIGVSYLMQQNEENKSSNAYDFTVAAMPEDIVAKVVSGEIDIAAVPTNMAATLYNKTEGKVKIAAVNTLGVLYLLENGDTIHTISDLAGKTIYASGQGATPEYILNYLLSTNQVKDATIEYRSEHAQLATELASDKVSIGMLPEPNVTAVMMKNDKVRIALDITSEWEKARQEDGKESSKLPMGCIIVRNDFLENNKEVFDKFLEEYKTSIEYTNDRIVDTAVLSEKFGIFPQAAAAERSIPNCNIVYIEGDEMKNDITNFYEVLFQADPKSVGGALPDDDFYYKK